MAVRNRATGVDEDALKLYFKEVSRIPLLTREQEVKLAQRAKEGSQEALNELVRRNLRYVASVASKYRGHNMSFSDLISEGNVGLIVAARRFDPTRNVKFITYAVWWIRQSILQALSRQSGIVGMPLKQMSVHNCIESKSNELRQKNSREPSFDELVKELEISSKEMLSTIRGYSKHLSLDVPINGVEDASYLDMLEEDAHPSIEEELINESLASEIRRVIEDLNPREREVLLMRYGFSEEPKTLEETGAHLGLSKERVRQIEVKAINRLKQKYRIRQLQG